MGVYHHLPLSLFIYVIPLAGEDAADAGAGSSSAPAAPVVTGSRRPAVLADGTYATQAAVVEQPSTSLSAATAVPNLRALLLGGDFFIGGVLAGTLTKLMLRLKTSGMLSGMVNGCLGTSI